MSKEEIIQVESTQESLEGPSGKSFLWELGRVVIFAFVFMIGFRMFVAEPFVVSGSSMVPNYHNREYLVVNKLSYRFGEIQRGDVVIFHYPKDPSQYFIKRIVGLPGEKVKIEGGRPVIYNESHPEGAPLKEPYLPDEHITFGDSEPVMVGADQYYVLGDNRLASSDSRVWGILPKANIVGKAWLRVFPINHAGFSNFPLPQF